jgi:hypothetical protein
MALDYPSRRFSATLLRGELRWRGPVPPVLSLLSTPDEGAVGIGQSRRLSHDQQRDVP